MAEASGDTYVRCGVFECSITPLVQRATWDKTFVTALYMFSCVLLNGTSLVVTFGTGTGRNKKFRQQLYRLAFLCLPWSQRK